MGEQNKNNNTVITTRQTWQQHNAEDRADTDQELWVGVYIKHQNEEMMRYSTSDCLWRAVDARWLV